jgi:hypothetical protein
MNSRRVMTAFTEDAARRRMACGTDAQARFGTPEQPPGAAPAGLSPTVTNFHPSVEVPAMHEPISPSLRTIIADTTDPAVRHVLHRDYETRGRLLLKRVGTHRYAADPGTEVLCGAFAIDNEPFNCGSPAIQCRRNLSKRRQIQAGSCARTMTPSRPRSSSTSWRRASTGRKFRRRSTAARWPRHLRWDCRRG